jgi:integrase
MSKRSNGTGSVYQRARDGRWCAAVTDPSTGRRRTAYFDDERAARRAVERMVVHAEDGHVVLARASTLRSWARSWVDSGRAARRRRPSTVAAYDYRLTAYVLPRIGGVRLRELTALDVDDLAHDLAAAGYSHATIKGALVALAACLADAVKGRHVPVNVAAGVEVPERAQRTRQAVAPTAAQVRAVVEGARGSSVEALVLLLATTGARIGEALGARWADVDLDAGVWSVRSTTTRAASGGVVVGERTKGGDERAVVLPDVTVAALREQRRSVAGARLAAGSAWHDHDLIFPSAVGTPQHSQNVRKVFRPIADAAGFPASFHGFRHHVAAVGLSVLPVAVVSKQLGHRRSSMTTDTYGHLLASDGATVAALLSASLSASGGE